MTLDRSFEPDFDLQILFFTAPHTDCSASPERPSGRRIPAMWSDIIAEE